MLHADSEDSPSPSPDESPSPSPDESPSPSPDESPSPSPDESPSPSPDESPSPSPERRSEPRSQLVPLTASQREWPAARPACTACDARPWPLRACAPSLGAGT